jgi:hypothetical protein
MTRERTYKGLRNDEYGGLNPTGTIIRDAWVFGILPETEDCAGWTADRLGALYDQVHQAWLPYGHLASNLPADLRERHARIYAEAVAQARESGWDPDLSEEAD